MAKFSIPLAELAAKANADIDTLTRKVTLDLFSAVVLRAPVDTGRFRANFNVTNGAPDTTTSESTDQGRATTEIAKVLDYKVGGVVTISNSLPYGPRLEYEGWSKQAPMGFIRISVAELSDHITAALAKS